jgi:hypothetical protein
MSNVPQLLIAMFADVQYESPLATAAVLGEEPQPSG